MQNHITVTLTPELRLEQALGVTDLTTVTKLTILGMPVDDDFKYICKNMSITLRELDMGNAWVTKIGTFAFFKCTGLTSITLPASIVQISEYTFVGCTSLISINVSDSLMDCKSSVYKEK